jgi:hypothetical protein
VDREYDRIENLPQTVIGTDQNYRVNYRGRLPTPIYHAPCGSAELWANGVSFVTYQNGGYVCDCPPLDYLPALLQGSSTVLVSPAADMIHGFLVGSCVVAVSLGAVFMRHFLFGSLAVAVSPGAEFPGNNVVLLESGEFILTESGGTILLES